MPKKPIYVLIFFLTAAATASRPQSLNGFDLSDALIPSDEIRHGGPPRDGIPSIDAPTFLIPTDAVSPDIRVLGVSFNGVSKAYPINILNYHEIVNDKFDGKPVVITYCPLCGSGVAFLAEVKDRPLTFGVSGLLYNSDVLMYDRETESLWSQLESRSVSGVMKGEALPLLPTANTTWSEWRSRYPDSKLLSEKTGHNRNYQRTPYVGYDESKSLYFPVRDVSERYHPKEKVIGLQIKTQYKAYPFSELRKSGSIVHDSISGTAVVVHFDEQNDTARITNSLGEELPHITTFWFAWYAFHPGSEVYSSKQP